MSIMIMITLIKIIMLLIISMLTLHICDSTLLNRCMKAEDFSFSWTKHIGNQFIASPLISDLTLDPGLEIVSLTQSGELTVIHADTGEILHDSSWPVKVGVTSVHSGPLLYDVNKDGAKDILVVSTEGEIRVYSVHGKLLENYNRMLPEVFIQKDWYEDNRKILASSNGYSNFFGYIVHNTSDISHNIENYIQVHPHVFATGVIEDLNKDKVIEELVLPVTYMVEESELYGHINNADLPLLHSHNNYLASAIVIFNLTSFKVSQTYFTQLDKKTSQYPPFAFTSPHIITASGDSLEVMLPAGNSLVSLFPNGKRGSVSVNGETGIIEHLVTQDLVEAADISVNKPELVYTTHTGNVVCMTSSANGAQIWRTSVKGKITGIRLFKRKTVNGSFFKVIVVATADGQVWLLNGADGKPLPRWPLKLGKSLMGPPNIVQNLPDGPILVCVIDTDGNLHMTTIEQNCKVLLKVGETSRVGLVMHDLDPHIPGLEILVSSTHGSLLALGLNAAGFHSGTLVNQASTDDMYSLSTLTLYAWPAETKSHNVLMHSAHSGCVITNIIGQANGLIEIQFSLFDHKRDISFLSNKASSIWSADIYLGAQYITTVMDANNPNTLDSIATLEDKQRLNIGFHSVVFKTDKLSSLLHIELRCHFLFDHLHSHTVAYKVQQSWTNDLGLLLLLPFVFLLFIYLADLFVNQKKGIIITGQHLE